MERQRLNGELRRTIFQQKKLAEELAYGMPGMDVPSRNASLEQLGYKVTEEEIITASAKAAGDEAATWAAKCAEQKPKFPSRTLCYLVSFALSPSSYCCQNATARVSKLNLKRVSELLQS